MRWICLCVLLMTSPEKMKRHRNSKTVLSRSQIKFISYSDRNYIKKIQSENRNKKVLNNFPSAHYALAGQVLAFWQVSNNLLAFCFPRSCSFLSGCGQILPVRSVCLHPAQQPAGSALTAGSWDLAGVLPPLLLFCHSMEKTCSPGSFRGLPNWQTVWWMADVSSSNGTESHH